MGKCVLGRDVVFFVRLKGDSMLSRIAGIPWRWLTMLTQKALEALMLLSMVRLRYWTTRLLVQ